jgi:hypothetical protein
MDRGGRGGLLLDDCGGLGSRHRVGAGGRRLLLRGLGAGRARRQQREDRGDESEGVLHGFSSDERLGTLQTDDGTGFAPAPPLDEDRSLWRAVGAYFCSVLVVVVVVFVVLEGFVATTLETIIESPSLT